MQKPVRRALAALLATVALVGSAAAQYPTKPIKWVVPYPPAGTTDVLARIVAQSLSENIGQQVVVENKPGAGNNIGTEFVINSPPDGYTMLLVNPANGINATLYKNLNYNFIRDIEPVAGLVRAPGADPGPDRRQPGGRLLPGARPQPPEPAAGPRPDVTGATVPPGEPGSQGTGPYPHGR